MIEITEKNYKNVLEFFKKRKFALLALKICYSFLPLLIFINYPLLIIYVFFCMPEKLLKIILIPLGVFIFVTVLRKIINEQRPYEKYGTPALFGKTTKGQSMPSRHTASAFIISMAYMFVNFDMGIVALSVTILITVSRVLAGVHFIRDVLAGMALSILSGIVFFYLC